MVYVIDLYKQPVATTDFKLNLKKGCEELGIPFNYSNVKDITIDDIVKDLLKQFNNFYQKLNQILFKQNCKGSDIRFVVNALNKGINNPEDQKQHLDEGK